MQCLLDMDGVLVDFVKGMVEAHGLPDPYADESFIDFYFDKAWGLSATKFWNVANRDFWSNLDWMPDGVRILEIVELYHGHDNVCLLSSPCSQDGCVDGKLDWIKRHVPQYKRRFLFGPRKEFCAAPGRVLIDDNEDNVDAFVKCGGVGILVPRPWNRNRGLHAVKYVGDRLDQLRLERLAEEQWVENLRASS